MITRRLDTEPDHIQMHPPWRRVDWLGLKMKVAGSRKGNVEEVTAAWDRTLTILRERGYLQVYHRAADQVDGSGAVDVLAKDESVSLKSAIAGWLASRQSLVPSLFVAAAGTAEILSLLDRWPLEPWMAPTVLLLTIAGWSYFFWARRRPCNVIRLEILGSGTKIDSKGPHASLSVMEASYSRVIYERLESDGRVYRRLVASDAAAPQDSELAAILDLR